MNDTSISRNTAAACSSVSKQLIMQRHKTEKIRSSVLTSINELQRQIEKIDEAQKLEYTSYVALFKKLPQGGFECLKVVDYNNLPEEQDMPEDFDLSMPIPVPESLPEFEGW